MTSRFLPAVAATAALLLAGCATNRLRVDYAANVRAAGDAAVASSKGFLRRVEQSRRDTRVELIIADPACSPTRPVLRADPQLSPKAPAVGAICLSDGGDPARALDFTPIDRDLVPTLDLIAAIVVYSDALGEIVDDTPVDPGQSLADAHETALAAQNAFVAVLGLGAGPIPGADDPRVQAVIGFVRFVGELAAEQGKVDDLRALVATNPDGVQQVTRTLIDHLSALENRRRAERNLTQTVRATLMRRVLDRRDPLAPADDRRAALVAFYDREDASAAHDRLYPALNQLVVALQKSDTDFRRVLDKNAKLTPEERVRVREIARQRIVKALNLVAELATSFRGA